MNNNNKLTTVRLLVGLAIVLSLMAYAVFAAPVSPVLTYVANDTSSSASSSANRSDSGGYIITLRLNVTQQNYGWKAYVGNVSGTLVLEDQDNFSIYGWSLSGTDQEVYISRNTSINWSGIGCATPAEITSEDTALNINSTSVDSINRTFNYTAHSSFTVSGVAIANSTCYSTATYINDTVQTVDESASFQEVLLADNTGKLVYTTIIESNVLGFDNGVYDFQAIIAEDETAGTPTTYYFYVELQ